MATTPLSRWPPCVSAMEHETAQGHTPRDVSKTGVGCDIRSESPDGAVRYIEVKGHAATGSVTLYYTEWQMAHRMRGEFFIYEVDHALTEPKLWITQDPVGKGIQATERVVEYHIDSGRTAVSGPTRPPLAEDSKNNE